jgi:D-psicose/D-tagatose/L-ribulose 3-epimerase
MKYGLNLMLWTDHMHDGMLPILERVKRIGYDGVEVPVFDLDQAGWQAWARRLDDLGLERTANHVVALEHNPVSGDPAVRQRAFDHMRGIIDACHTLGATVLAGPNQVALGYFTGRGPTDEEWGRSVAHVRRLAEYAAGAGVLLVEEVVNRFELYLLNTLDQAIRFVDEVGNANCRIHLDTFHAHIEEKDVPAAVRRAGARIGYVHISENDRGVPGSGQVAWAGIFDALHDIGYDGWLTVESFGTALPNLVAATKIWRPLFDSEDQVAAEGFALMRREVTRASGIPA